MMQAPKLQHELDYTPPHMIRLSYPTYPGSGITEFHDVVRAHNIHNFCNSDARKGCIHEYIAFHNFRSYQRSCPRHSAIRVDEPTAALSVTQSTGTASFMHLDSQMKRRALWACGKQGFTCQECQWNHLMAGGEQPWQEVPGGVPGDHARLQEMHEGQK